ncbi:hypothetical protein CVT25_007120 [Psilocybe cyanescens]|uniref:GH18 domain-containing protein n=1 Tax=Psilocybe cyanescens TaxID=93625 RepID=A0A409WVX1_PSICY|nr:hypothetical protein CVT25_007120 [Psilocybe cyanescens]
MYRDAHTPLMLNTLLAALAFILSTSSTVLVSAAPRCGLVVPTPPSLSAQTGSNGSGNSSVGDGMDVVATGWYPGWLGSELSPSQISWTKYSALTFAFATTTPDPSMIALDDESAALLPTFVNEAHNNGVDALLSIGGWTGSIYYSTAVGNAANRTTFVKAVLDMANKYALDGIDFDWEYPSHQGIGCNTISDDDSANFLSFLQELRQDPEGAQLTLTAAVGLTPFAGPGGTPLSNVSAFADVLDHIAIMNYDVWGTWSADVGPNAPLNDSCAPVQAGSATSAVKAWTDANFPVSKIVLGVAAYGHSFHVATSDAVDGSGALSPYPPFDKSQQPLGDSDVPGAPPSVDQCGNSVGVGGTFNFKGMVAAGFLDANGNAAPGIDYRFDNCSQTPFVYNSTEQTMISYDDKTSFIAKGNFIEDNGLAGFAIWHIAGDSNDILLDSISDALSLEQSMLTKNVFLYLITSILPFVSALPPPQAPHDEPLLPRGFKHSPVPLHYPGLPTNDGSTTSPSQAKNDTVIAAWYPGWLASTYPPDKLSWSKYNIMTFSFASVPTSDPANLSIDSKTETVLPEFVSQAKKYDVKAVLSIGGWAGSQHFSTIMSTPENRTTFVKTVLDTVSKYNLDGIDFDWEYPGKKGDLSNTVSPDDSDNFLLFLQELRKDPAGANLVLSAAVGMTPFVGTDGEPKSDVSAFADVFDFIAIMAYDIWGAWSPNVGPNAPLYDRCSSHAAGSAETAIEAWTSAKFPTDQIVLGLASYGRGYTVEPSEADKIGNFPSFETSSMPAGDEDSSTTVSSTNSGLFNFQGLVKNGYLKDDGKPASDVKYKFDDCSQTPYLYKESSRVMVSFDDATSFASKTRYVKDHGLGGVALWHGVGDYNDILLDSVHSAMASS